MKGAHQGSNGAGGNGCGGLHDALWARLSKLPAEEVDEMIAGVLTELSPREVIVGYHYYGEGETLAQIASWIGEACGRTPSRSTVSVWRDAFTDHFVTQLRRALDRRDANEES